MRFLDNHFNVRGKHLEEAVLSISVFWSSQFVLAKRGLCQAAEIQLRKFFKSNPSNGCDESNRLPYLRRIAAKSKRGKSSDSALVVK